MPLFPPFNLPRLVDRNEELTPNIVVAKRRRIHGLKRSMVKLASVKTSVFNSVDSETAGNSTVATRDSTHGGPLRGSDVCKENSKKVYAGRVQGNSSDCATIGNIDSMEGNKAVVPGQQSENGRRGQEGEVRLTVEEYIGRRRQIAIEQVMAGFLRWLDKRLAIISYTIEASEAADGMGTDTRTTDSQNPGKDGKESGGTGSRPKRQLSDDNEPDDVSGGGDDGGRDRGGNKRVKKDPDPEETKLACPFHKHNPKAHRKDVCVKGGWKSIHRLKEHLYRVHLLPKHNCPRCNLCFDNDKELQAHLRADDPCKKSNVAREEGIDQDMERKLRERKKYNSGQTEVQRWNDIYLLLFPGADRNAIPSPYPETTTRAGNLERYKRVETRIKKELPRLVRQRVERRFEKVEADMLQDINDIIRNCLADFFRNNMSQDEGPSSSSPSTVTPQTASRATTPGSLLPLPAPAPAPAPPSPVLVVVEEAPVAPPPPSFADDCLEQTIDISDLLDDPDMGFGGHFSLFDCDPRFCVENSPDMYGVDKISSDSGYVSTSTFR